MLKPRVISLLELFTVILVMSSIYIYTQYQQGEFYNDKTSTRFILNHLDETDNLQGVDKNANGVRDDIERYIKSVTKNNVERSATMQLAKVVQREVTVGANLSPAMLDVLLIDAYKSVQCFTKTFKASSSDPKQWSRTNDIFNKIETLTPNTYLRSKAYKKFSSKDGISMANAPLKDVCDL